MVRKISLKRAFPVMLSYVFLALAYGMMMESAGFGPLWSLGISLTVYTGAFQYVLVSFLRDGASYLTVALTALFMNARQSFYALTFLDDFRAYHKAKPYMIESLTDESFAVDCSLLLEKEEKEKEGTLTEDSEKMRHSVMLRIAIYCQLTWSLFAGLGGLLGQLIPVQLQGIDFCMTALFVTILIDQWKKTNNHLPAILGLGISVVLLLLMGADRFMLPSLVLTSGILIAGNTLTEKRSARQAVTEQTDTEQPDKNRTASRQGGEQHE